MSVVVSSTITGIIYAMYVKDSVWQSTGDTYHLLYVVYDMLDEFANKPQLVPAYERSASASH